MRCNVSLDLGLRRKHSHKQERLKIKQSQTGSSLIKHSVCQYWPFIIHTTRKVVPVSVSGGQTWLPLYRHAALLLIIALTSECDAAEGEYGETGRLLECGVTLPASEHWPWGELALFSVGHVSVDGGALVETAQPPGDD